LGVAAAAYLLWHAFRGQPQTDSKDTDLLAVGMISFVLAVALTLNGLGYQFHVLKIMVLALLYVTAALLLWDAFKKRSASAQPHRS
jgi:threonine/homoserine/homoserine lactone efflux protein